MPEVAAQAAPQLTTTPWESTAHVTLTFTEPQATREALDGLTHVSTMWLVGDYNGDGKTDLVSEQAASSAAGQVWLATGQGTFEAHPTRFQEGRSAETAEQLQCTDCLWLVGDTDNDGQTDLIHIQQGGQLSILRSRYKDGERGGYFEHQAYQVRLPTPNPGQYTWLVGDFDGDNHSDVLALDQLAERGLLLFSTPQGSLTQLPVALADSVAPLAPQQASAQSSESFWLAGDLNGDGRTDLVRRSKDGRDNRLYFSQFQHQEGGFELDPNTPADSFAGVPPTVRWSLGDLDGDGDADLVAQEAATVALGFFSTEHGHTFGNVSLTLEPSSTTTEPTPLLLGDFDGDGRLDLLQAGAWQAWQQVWLSRFQNDGQDGGLQVVQNPSHIAATAPEDLPPVHLGDFNGDGYTDLLTGQSLARDDQATGTPQVYLARYAEQHPLFVPGASSEQGQSYARFRIPAIVTTLAGTLVAFAEGRVDRAGTVSPCDGNIPHLDSGNIDIVTRHSTDGGRTWGPIRTILNAGCETVGNPTPVVDRETGKIWLFVSENSGHINGAVVEPGQRRVWLTHSADGGHSWAQPRHLSGWAPNAELGVQAPQERDPAADCQPSPEDEFCVPTDPDDWAPTALLPHSYKVKGRNERWTWDAVGPGIGIQTRSGRLVIPARGRNLYSDDHGTSWAYEWVDPGCVDEGTVAELSDGRLLRNGRASGRCAVSTTEDQNYRQVSTQHSDGSWPRYRSDTQLPDSLCQGSLLAIPWADRQALIFTNSASQRRRAGNLKTRFSLDDGVTWSTGKGTSTEHENDFMADRRIKIGGYSSMIAHGRETIAALIEASAPDTLDNSQLENAILFQRFNLNWLRE